MAKKKKKRKIQPKLIKIKPENYIRKNARKLPIYECLIDPSWKETGMTPVIVTRKKYNDDLILGSYIIDTFCLGLKNTDFRMDMTSGEYEDYMERISMGMGINFVKVKPTLAFNIIYGAIEYADDIGFSPHRDFKITEYILDDVEEIEFIDIEFGLNGKPFFMSGPHDNAKKILAVLEKNVGKGNYNFTIGGNPLFLEEDSEFDEGEDIE